MSSAEERGDKDTDTFELFKKDLDRILEKHYSNTDYEWDYLSDNWIEVKLWLRENPDKYQSVTSDNADYFVQEEDDE